MLPELRALEQRLNLSSSARLIRVRGPADGTPTMMIRLPPQDASRHFAYDGRTLALWQSGEIHILDSSGQALARFRPRIASRQANDWPLFIAAQRRELWMFDAARKTMHRFEVPWRP
jgi:hypothetical protein